VKGQSVTARVDVAARAATARNHSVTHIMHKALREVLGAHVQQKGSLVDPDKTRFDFTHNAPMTAEEIREVEEIVNREVLANTATHAELMALEAAQQSGAVMLFGEKYADEVRVLSIGSSKELCGGTHVARTGDIGLFKIEAITGENALRYLQEQERRVQGLSAAMKVQPDEVVSRVAGIMDNVRALEKEIARLKSKLASSQGDDLAAKAIEVSGARVLAATLDGADVATLREAMDKLKDKLGSAAIVLASGAGGKVSLIAGVTADLTGRLKAGELVNMVAQQVGGKGGGRPDMAQAGGTQPENLPAALASVADWVGQRLR
jgi:alanyl-tRNA synthetase